MSAPDLTYPHDYRLICAGQPPAVVVGGQAVNLWAISYLEPDGEGIATRFGSGDLDVLAEPALLERLKHLPGWGYRQNDLRNFLDSRVAFMSSVSSDNRRLLVEILHGGQPDGNPGTFATFEKLFKQNPGGHFKAIETLRAMLGETFAAIENT